ncbi:MAG TPA: YciI family protein [Candidatus Sulfotelmatobacter sp.]|nr:YciI family protein [Candidatus Sulfotelmatobacter sp.]
MMIVKASKDSEAGKLPSDEMIAAMGKYNEELMKAGVLVELGGLQSSAKGARVRFSSSNTTVIDGPFAETRELIAGYWVINVKSREEAIAWARRVPPPHGPDQECELEIRQFFELEDFVPSEAVDHHKELGKKLAAGKK